MSESTFLTVARLLERDTRTAPKQEKAYPLSGILFCGDCHAPMKRRTVKRGKKSFSNYICLANKKNKECSSHSTAVDFLHEKLLNAVRLQVSLVVETDELLKQIGNQAVMEKKIRSLDLLISRKTEELETQQDFRMRLYEHMSDGIIKREEFSSMRQVYTSKIAKTEEILRSLQQEREDAVNAGSLDCSWMEHFKKNRNVDVMDRELAVTLLDRVEVFDDKRIEVSFNFNDELQQLREYLEKSAGQEQDVHAEAV